MESICYFKILKKESNKSGLSKNQLIPNSDSIPFYMSTKINKKQRYN